MLHGSYLLQRDAEGVLHGSYLMQEMRRECSTVLTYCKEMRRECSKNLILIHGHFVESIDIKHPKIKTNIYIRLSNNNCFEEGEKLKLLDSRIKNGCVGLQNCKSGFASAKGVFTFEIFSAITCKYDLYNFYILFTLKGKHHNQNSAKVYIFQKCCQSVHSVPVRVDSYQISARVYTL